MWWKLAGLFAAVLLAIDLLWLKGAQKLHYKTISAVQRQPPDIKVQWGAAFYVLGIIAFMLIIRPLAGTDITEAAKYGALMGLLMYGTFDFTNKAIFVDYPTDYALMDTLWGVFAMASASALTVWLAKVSKI